MAPPLVKGRALARRRLSGIVFLAVLGLLLQTSVWMYQKRFVDVVHVSLRTDRIGNQLTPHADVKLRGIVIGEVRGISSKGDTATLELALDEDKAGLVSRDVRAQLLPKTLFGEKQVVLVQDDERGPALRDGDVIEQDRTSTALETEQALNDLLPLLRQLRPQVLSTTLNALSAALRDRGDRLGRNFVAAEAYFRQLNPELEQVGVDMQGLADLTETIATSTPDVLRELDNFAVTSRSLVDQRAQLDTFLASTRDFAGTAEDLVGDNEERLFALARDSRAPLELYARYSDTYSCFLSTLAFQEIEGERTFGGGQPGLHITLELTKDRGGFAAGDEPENKDDFNSHCFGLGKKHIIPFPQYRNVQDGYRDSAPAEDPGTGPGGCCAAAAWAAEVASAPRSRVARARSFPLVTTQLDALLLAPLTGTS